MDVSSQPTVGQKHQTAETEPLGQSGSQNLHDGASRTTSARPSSAPEVTPPQGTTDDREIEAAQRREVLDVPSNSEEQEESDTDDECLPPHFVDIFAGKNRPMSRAMEWCGWTTSSFEKVPAECGCIWAECKCGKSKDVKLESVQTEVFNQMRRAQATWIALDCRTLTKASIPIPGQKHPPKPLRSAEDLWGKARLEPSSSSTGVQQTQGNEPLSAAERSLLLEQNDLIAFVEEALKIIHEANEGAEVRQLGIIENPRKSWLWDFDFMKMSQWSLDTAEDEEWTDVVTNLQRAMRRSQSCGT